MNSVTRGVVSIALSAVLVASPAIASANPTRSLDITDPAALIAHIAPEISGETVPLVRQSVKYASNPDEQEPRVVLPVVASDSVRILPPALGPGAGSGLDVSVVGAIDGPELSDGIGVMRSPAGPARRTSSRPLGAPGS